MSWLLRPSDCGAQFITARGDWVIASGEHKIITAARTLDAAELALALREIDLRRSHAPDLPACMRVITVDPRGRVVPGQAVGPRQVGARPAQR